MGRPKLLHGARVCVIKQGDVPAVQHLVNGHPLLLGLADEVPVLLPDCLKKLLFG